MAVGGERGGRVLLIDDHPLTREGLSLAARAAMPGVAVVGAGSASEAISAIQRGEWRMILLDLKLPDAHGLSALLTLQTYAPTTSIVVVTAVEKPSVIEAARALGAAGYLLKSLSLDHLSAELRRVDNGELAFPPTVAMSGIDDLKARLNTLSPAQLRVLLALAGGCSNKQLARELDVTPATIKAHLTAIYRKLDVENRTQALLMLQPVVGW